MYRYIWYQSHSILGLVSENCNNKKEREGRTSSRDLKFLFFDPSWCEDLAATRVVGGVWLGSLIQFHSPSTLAAAAGYVRSAATPVALVAVDCSGTAQGSAGVGRDSLHDCEIPVCSLVLCTRWRLAIPFAWW